LFEEAEEVFVHPRDPFVRVDALQSSRHVRVERDGHLLAESDSAILVFETGLPSRYYLPERDVDSSLLADSDLQTGCPSKGFASYRTCCSTGDGIAACSGSTRRRSGRSPPSRDTLRPTTSAWT